MLRLRKILFHNYIYYILLFLAFIYTFISLNIYHKTSYKGNSLEARISKIEVKDYGIKLLLKGKEKILGIYYIEDYEIKDFIKNYSLNDKVKITYEDIDLSNNTIFNGFNYKKYLYNNKILKYVNIKSIKLIKKNTNIFFKIKNYIVNKTLNLTSNSFISSLFLGDNSMLDKEFKDSIKYNGISHLFSISGLHVTLLCGFLISLLKMVKIGENKRYLLCIIFLLFYMFITNFSSSITRAGIFNILILINKIKYFYIKNINLLILTLVIILFINPFIIYNVGFLFSFTNTLFLVLFGYKLNSKNKIVTLFKTSVVAFLASFPIMANNFYQVNFLSVVYNLFFIPYISYIVLPGVLLTYFLPFLDRFLNILLLILTKVSLFFSKVNIGVIAIPKMSSICIIIYYVVLILLLKTNKKRYIIILLIIFITCISVKPSNNYLMFFDVDQGDSSLIYLNKKAILIDTGGKMGSDKYSVVNEGIIPYFKSVGIKRVEYLILTHGDYDHMGEAINLVNNFKVEKVIFNCGEYNDLEKELIEVLDKKKIPYYSCIKELNIDKNKLYFLQTKEYDNENDNSNVIYTELSGYKFMFMGDVGIDKERDILDKYNISNIDVLKVGHHGSRTSSSKTFIDEINPKYSIISVGNNNRYGHPNKEVLDNLKNSKIYRTDQDGSIMFKIKNKKLKIETCSP